jgi:ABC-2 type transport system permease protein
VSIASRTAQPRVARAATEPARLPGALAVGLSRARFELLTFFRQRDFVVFTFALPIVLLMIFGSIFTGEIPHTDIDFRQYFIAGIIASGIMSTTFGTLGIAVAVDRDDGTLKRLAGTPMPPAAYLIGKIACAIVLSAAETAVMLAVGTGLYGLHLPATAGQWITFCWVFVLSVTACTLLGIAVSAIPRSARSAAGVVNLPYLVLQFISGVYFPFTTLPRGLQQIAALFPLKWMCQGLRSVFLPAAAQQAEPGGSWQHGWVALILVAWAAAGLLLCLRTFRWTSGASPASKAG